MSRKYLVALDLAKNELQNAVVQNLASAPSSPVKGQLYYNSTGGDDTLYWWNGSAWVPAKAGAASFGSVVPITTFGAASADGVSSSSSRADHNHGSPAHNNAAHAAINLSALAAPAADVPWGNFKITGLGTPTAATDAATKGYADNLTAGLSWKEACRAATTANITLSGLTALDGVTPAANDRILVKNQTAGQDNGIYLAASGAWTRAADADAAGELDGFACFVMEGTTLADTAWVNTTNAPITVGTTPLVIVQFGAGTAYQGGAGLTLTASTFDVVAANGSIVVGANDVQVGYAGTGAAVTAARSDHNHDGTYSKKFSADVGGSTAVAIAHNLATRDVVVELYRNSTPWDSVEADVERTDANTVTFRFTIAPAAAAYRAVIHA